MERERTVAPSHPRSSGTHLYLRTLQHAAHPATHQTRARLASRTKPAHEDADRDEQHETHTRSTHKPETKPLTSHRRTHRSGNFLRKAASASFNSSIMVTSSLICG
ncbi:hypothetical protein Sros01_72710 [Streptomyces roseochromogenus]|nr:hypothetical protein Sros01_72710 [Streptomyces roseochromogenus]